MSHAHAHPSFNPSGARLPAGHLLARLPVFGGIAAVVGIGGSLALAGSDPRHFYFGWLAAFLYWITVALGAWFFVIIQFPSRAGWSVTVRRLAETLAATLPLFILLFIPVAMGLHELYPWTHSEAAHEEAIASKLGYLNPGFFLVRAAIYFAIWTLGGLFFYRLSVRQDTTTSKEARHALTYRMQRWSPLFIVGFALSITFAGFDWAMSLSPVWYSTMFGVYVFAGSTVAGFSAIALLAVALRRGGADGAAITIEHLHDLGKLCFAFTVFWAYIAYSQYMLMWYANIPEETAWYAQRWAGSWQGWSVLLAVGHFGVPFLFLMSRHPKRNPVTLAIGAGWLLAMHYVDTYWLTVPAMGGDGSPFGLVDILAFVGIGGAVLALFGFLLRRHATVPLGDPRLPESLAFENM